MKQCKICDTYFEPAKRGENGFLTYCSEECVKQSRRNRYAEKTARVKAGDHIVQKKVEITIPEYYLTRGNISTRASFSAMESF